MGPPLENPHVLFGKLNEEAGWCREKEDEKRGDEKGRKGKGEQMQRG